LLKFFCLLILLSLPWEHLSLTVNSIVLFILLRIFFGVPLFVSLQSTNQPHALLLLNPRSALLRSTLPILLTVQ
jgi:hypothetical protein